MPLQLLPDVEKLVIDFLRANADVQAAAPGGVHGQVPGQPTWPLLTVQRFGGAAPYPAVVDRAHLQISGWAADALTDEIAAEHVASTARAVLHLLIGTQATGIVSGVDELSGPGRIPDPTTKPARARYRFDVIVHVRALPA